MSLLQTALKYTTAGVSVIPVIGKKSPVRWSDYQYRIASESEIRSWDKAGHLQGVAIVCGQVSLGGLVVVDLDGPDAVARYEARWPQYLNTLCVLSGSGQGKHYYYKSPDTRTYRVKGTELRGDGCYVVAPPSPHASGKLYTVAKRLPILQTDLEDFRRWLQARPKPSPDVPSPAAVTDDTLRRAMERELDRLRGTHSHFNDALNRTAFILGGLVAHGLPYHAAESALYSVAVGCGYVNRDGQRQTLATIKSGLDAGQRRPLPKVY